MQTNSSYQTLKAYVIANYPVNDQRLILNYIDSDDYEIEHPNDLKFEADSILIDANACDSDVITDMLNREPA